jgi:limonene-1,2-epoxide hydrolase
VSTRTTRRRRFLTASGTGVLALLSHSTAGAAGSPADEWTDAEKANVKTVTDFCAAWSTRDLAKVFPFLADDCVYRMSETTAPAHGHEGVSEKLKSWLADSSQVQFRILQTHAAGPIVINHRIDRFETSRPLTWEGVGVFFVKDGKIKEWSDYTIRTQR